jgi:transposase
MEVIIRPAIPIPENRRSELNDFRKNKWSGFEFQRFLCVWLRLEQGLSNKVIVDILGWNINTVRITQRDFISRGIDALVEEKRGGRRRQLMTIEEEKSFLASFEIAARDGEILVANEIRASLEKHLGRTVHKSTVYRLLRRHNWRKVMPRPKHPKQDELTIEAFKKGASPT